MNKAFTMAGQRPDKLTPGAASSPAAKRAWSFSQIAMFFFVFCVFSIAGNKQLGFIEDLAGYIFFIAVAVESIRRGQINFYIPVELRFAMAFVIWLLFSLCIEGLFVDSNFAAFRLDRFFNFLQVFVLGVLIVAVLIRHQDIRPLEFAMYAGVIYSALLMLNDLFMGGGLARAGGGIGQPNELGVGLAMASAFSFSRLVLLSMDDKRKGSADLLLTGGLLGIQFLAAYMNFAWTGSRTGMVLCSLIIAFSIGTLCYGAAQGKPRLLLLIVGVVIGLPSVVQLLSDTNFVERLSNVYLYFSGQALAVREQSLSNRGDMIQTGLDLWRQKPIFGWGFDSFRYVSGFQTYSHSNYVELLANHGIVGLGIYLSIFVVAMVRTIRLTAHSHNKMAIRLMLFLLIGVLLASGVTAVTYYRKAHWILLGLIVMLISMAPNLGRNKTPSQTDG